jgi:hypothetical protein
MSSKETEGAPVMQAVKHTLPLAKKTTMLYLLTHNMSITGFLKELTPPELVDLREFLIIQSIDLSDHLSDRTITKSDIYKLMTPIQSYFMSQDCREPMHSCQNDTCFELEPQCFKKKLFGQIGAVYEYIREQISAKHISENNTEANVEPGATDEEENDQK